MPRRKCCIDRISSSHEPNCSSPIVISSPNPLFNDPFSQLHRMRYQFYPPIIFTLLHIPMLFINHTFIMLEFSLVKYLIKKLSQHIHTFFLPTFQHVNWNVIWSCRIIILFHFQWFFILQISNVIGCFGILSTTTTLEFSFLNICSKYFSHFSLLLFVNIFFFRALSGMSVSSLVALSCAFAI